MAGPLVAPTVAGIPGGAAPVVAEANNGGAPANPAVSDSSVLTPTVELGKLATDPSFAGGQYYGRTPNGIADLVNGGLVQADGSPVPGSSADPTIAASGVQRYTGAQTPVTGTTGGATDTSQTDTGTDTSGSTSGNATDNSITDAATAFYGAGGPQQPDTATIRANVMSELDSQIAGIKAGYAPLFAAQASANTVSAGKTRAVTARTGVEGQDMGNSEVASDANAGQAKVDAINAKMNAAISAAIDKANLQADTEVQQAQTTADSQETGYLGALKSAQPTATSAATAAKASIASLAKGGIPLSSLTTDEVSQLASAAGMDSSLFNAFYNANLPQNQQRKYTYVKNSDGSVTPVYVDPTTGEPVAESPIEPPGGATQYDKFQVLPDGTAVWVNSKTGQAVVAGTNGTDIAGADGKTNFAKPPASAKTATQSAADKLGKAWLQEQPDFTSMSAADQATYLSQYASDPVFHASVNAEAAKAIKPSTTSTGFQ